MVRSRATAKINIKAVIILVTAIVVLAGAAGVLWTVRRRRSTERALATGRDAFEKGDWGVAAKNFRTYLSEHHSDPEILKKYGDANLLAEPLTDRSLKRAIWAYNELMLVTSDDPTVYEKLAKLHVCRRVDQERLAYVTEKWLERFPHDPTGAIWRAETLLMQEKDESTRQAEEILKDLIVRLEPEPAKRVEYVMACGLLSMQALRGSGDPNDAAEEAKAWADKAVQYDPGSDVALVSRANLLRIHYTALGWTRQEMLEAVFRDLEQADALEPTNPRVLRDLCSQWARLGQYDRAAEELEKLNNAGHAAVREEFIDPHYLLAQRFLLAAELAKRTGIVAGAVAQADEALATLKHPGYRIGTLPEALEVYAIAGREAEAKKCLEEYEQRLAEVISIQDANQRLARLRAILIRLEDRPDKWVAIIDVLEPLKTVGKTTPAVGKMLADAYARTGQPQRRVSRRGGVNHGPPPSKPGGHAL